MQSERNRQSFNQQAAGNGLNTGTASQAALAQNSAWQRDYGKLRTAQADAMATAQRGINDLTAQYQSNVAAATANNDYQRWAALLDEYNNQYQRNMQQAQTLAGYGDFSGYASLYGQETADNMSKLWTAQNPGLAYNMGRITAEEYRNMTGSYPAGYSAPSSGGGSGYYGGSGSYDEEIAELQRKLVAAGYNIPVDGIDGPLTQEANAKYQEGLRELFAGHNTGSNTRAGATNYTNRI